MFDESPDAAWSLRYGAAAPEIPDLGKFLNHRSVRRYSAEPVPESMVAGLVAAAQSASTSSNLQLWSVISIQEPARRAEVAVLCGDQRQVHEAPWFLAFIADHARLRAAAAAVGEPAEGLDYAEFYTMAIIDAALAAERMVCAAEALGLGCCYIGSLRNDPYAVQRLLKMPAGTFGVFGMCIGWPEESLRAHIKPRLGQGSVWFREEYGVSDVAEYDERMRAFYEGERMKGEVTWSMRSGKRVDNDHLGGREVLREFLEAQGFNRR